MMPYKKSNPKRISLSQVVETKGFESVGELLEEFGLESVVPACCENGCQVEPDGRCPHGNPSILLAAGII